MCLERIFDFADTVKKIHDIPKYPLYPCDVGSFADELYIHVHSERRSPRLMIFFLSLCKKCPQGFISYVLFIIQIAAKKIMIVLTQIYNQS